MLRVVAIDYRKYPFLANPSGVVNRHWPGLSLVDLLKLRIGGVFERTLEVVKSIISSGRVPRSRLSTEEEVASFYTVVLVASMVGSKWLMDRIAIAYSKQALEHLRQESPETIVAIARRIGVELSFSTREAPRIPLRIKRGSVIYKILPYSMSLRDYLKYSKRLINDPKYALTNQILDNGLVYMEFEVALRVLGEALTNYIKSLFKPVHEIPSELKDVVEDVRKLLEETSKTAGEKKVVSREYRGSVEEFKGVVDLEALPPCMKRIFDELKRGENLSHHERFAIAAFLLRIGMSVEDVLDLFRNAPDFNERIARYQVEHIAGLRGSRRQYLPYSCQTMKSLGLCISDCGGKNPLTIYYRNLRNKARRNRGSG